MEITAKVMLHVRLADGRTIHVAHEVDRRTGDNPAYAAGEALDALTEAQTALLRGFAAQLGQDAPEAAPEPPLVEAFENAVRQQTQPKTDQLASSFENDRVMSLIATVDRLGGDNGLGPAELGDLLEHHSSRTAGFTMPSHRILRRVSDIRNARKDPER